MTDVVEPETLIENGDSVEELAAGKCKNCGEPTTDGADVCMACKKKMADNGEELGLNDPTASVEATPDSGTWEGRLALTGVVTGDGRRLEPGGITHRTLPLPLMGMFENSGSGHNGAVIVGNITDIWTEGDSIYGKGNWDAGEDGQRCRQLAKDNMMRGISVDLDAVDDVEFVEGPNPYVNFGKARIMGATVTPFPAFADAEITMVASGEELNEIAIAGTEDGIRFTGYFTPVDGDAGGSVAVNVESFTMSNNTAEFSLQSIPVEPPAAWFDDPQLTRLQPLTIDANGRVFGHVAAWGSCHISYGDKCRDVPRCGTYKKFMNKTILCDDGSIRACGNVFINTEHADRKAGVDVASDHYANTGAAVADVAVYEDRFGLVIAGAVRPSATPEQIRIFRGSDVSPDWRKLRTKSNKTGKWELVGLLSVNTSGFVVDSLLASGDFKFAVVDGPAAYLSRNDDELEFVSLVAAGIVPRMSLEDRLNDALDRIDELTVKVEELSAKEAERQAFLQTMNLALEFEEVASRF